MLYSYKFDIVFSLFMLVIMAKIQDTQEHLLQYCNIQGGNFCGFRGYLALLWKFSRACLHAVLIHYSY